MKRRIVLSARRIGNLFWIFALVLVAACSTPPTSVHVVAALTDKALAGRQAGSAGERAAAEFVAAQFRASGVETQLQPFERGVNVIGVVRGQVEEAVVMGAHIDHLGPNHPGADDNASGVAALVMLAHRFSLRPARRTLVFIGFGAEEVGILGSRHYVQHPVAKAVAMLNMDMVGRMQSRTLLCIGADTSDVWERVLSDSNRSGLNLKLGKGGVGPSDHTAFYQAGIPVLHFFTGAHSDYHKPGDTPEKLNYEGIALVVDLVEGVARTIADAEGVPTYLQSSVHGGTSEGETPRGTRPYLGAMPDYAFNDRMQIADVSTGSPAEKAGLRAGDVIEAIDGKPVKDLQEYSNLFFSCKPGQEVVLRIRRGEDVLDVRATLGARGK